MMKYRKDSGLGSLISLMLPYSVFFFIVWTGFLLLWYAAGWPWVRIRRWGCAAGVRGEWR